MQVAASQESMHPARESWRTWQSDADLDIRKNVINQIYTLFKNKRPKVAGDWHQKLPEFTRRLEELLYKRARTPNEYTDPNTLSERLTEVARTLAGPRQSPSAAQQGRANSGPGDQIARPSSGARLPDNPFAHNSTSVQAAYNGRGVGQAPVMIPAPGVAQQSGPPALRENGSMSGSMAPMIPTPNINTAPMNGTYSRWPGDDIPQVPWNSQSQMAMQGTMGSMGMVPTGIGPRNGTDAFAHMGLPNGNYAMTVGPSTSAAIPGGAASTVNGSSATSNRSQDFKSCIQRQQRLLLFLRHCAKCQNPQCMYGANCRAGKELWQHIVSCKSEKCTYNRCVHARELLRHYQRCIKSNCPICGPVRQFVEQSKLSNREGVPPNGMFGPHGQAVPQIAGQDGYVAANAVRPDLRHPRSWDESGVLNLEAPHAKRSKMSIDEIKKQLGSSLLEMFSVDALQQHLRSTQEDMAKVPVPKSAAVQPLGEEEYCAMCNASHHLAFEPPPKSCCACGQRIRKNQFYYVSTAPPGCWCNACYGAAGEDLHIENVVVKKASIANMKRKNTEVENEPWVACDRCDRWVHMICGLFNKGNNRSETTFLCPWCLTELQREGQWEPMKQRPQSMLGAEDLPATQLSDAIEAQVKAHVAEDLVARAKAARKAPEELPQIDGLCVRVVNITDKVVDVKDQFLRAFRDRAYPSGFPFKQKVILLFQRIEGVDVLLFIVYVQEYGEKAPLPNRNTIYLSYLDSVKYFRPEGRDESCERALRSMVYHEILLAYMAHARRLGMNAIYIWSCPPLAGDDYVLYCHPAKQKNPRADKLREWYHQLLDRAQARGIVAFRSTLFDTFLPGGRDHAILEPSATLLPYFEGDFWPGEAETQLTEIASGAPAAAGKAPKGRNKNGKGKRYAGPVTTDSQLVQRLVENTVGSHQNSMKEDFIVAHFKTPCSMCTQYCSGVAWVLNKKREDLPKGDARGKSFDGIQLVVPGHERPDLPRRLAVCSACHAREVAAAAEGAPSRLPKQVTLGDLEQAACGTTGAEITDEDPIMDCEIFDTRTSFLSLCQGNHYQFDTLRRAKHSSMMTLYHLHNPDQPAFAGNCNLCNKDIEPGKGWKCKMKECADFELCQACYSAGGYSKHPHRLVRTGVDDATRQALTPEQRRVRAQTLRRTMMLLEHASACKDEQCPSKSCRKVKQLHKHAVQCKRKVSGGCSLCRHMWCLLNLHAKQCVRQDCPVPRCMELRELRRRQISREQDLRRNQYMKWRHVNQE